MRGGWLRGLVAGLVALEALALLIAGAALLVAAIAGRGRGVGFDVGLGLVALAIGAGLAYCARGVVSGRRWARAPVLTWQFLQLPVGGQVTASQRWYIGVPLLVVSVFVGVMMLGALPDSTRSDARRPAED